MGRIGWNFMACIKIGYNTATGNNEVFDTSIIAQNILKQATVTTTGS
jgi:hypothetical protein